MLQRTSWLVIAAAACIAGIAGYWLARELDRSAPQLASGTWLAQARVLPDFQLEDQHGQPFTLQSLRGKPSLLFFGFTHCPDVCPTTLFKLAQVKKAAALPGLQIALISVDPQRDTPQALAAYVRSFDPDFIGATGTPEQIRKVSTDFGVATQRVDLPGGDYTMDHTAAVFLTDRQGHIAAVFTPPFDSRTLVQDLRKAAPFLGASS